MKPTGCPGYQYVVEAVKDINDHDKSFESNGVKIVIDEQSLKYLAGTQLDYVREGLNEGFKFNNPFTDWSASRDLTSIFSRQKIPMI